MTVFARLLLCALLWLPPLVGSAVGDAPQPPPRRVLVLASFHRDLPAQRLFEQGLDEALRSAGPHQVFIEYLDGARLAPAPAALAGAASTHAAPAAPAAPAAAGSSPAAAPTASAPAVWPGTGWTAFLQSKYAAARIDVVVAFLPLASEFIVAQPQLLPRARRVHVEIAETRAAFIRRADPQARIVSPYVDYAPSIAEALRLTGARRLVAIGESRDAAATMRLAMFRAAVERDHAALPVEYWLDRPLAELKARSAALPPGSVVYFLLQFSDGAGRPMAPVDVARELAQHAPVPVVSQWESLIGSGVVGGYSLSHVLLGREAARAALTAAGDSRAGVQAGAGEAVTPASVMRHVYDARQLRRFGLDERALPPGSLLMFHEPTLFERYRGQVLVLGGVFAGLLALLLLLAASNRARRRVLTELAEERALLARRVAERTAELDERVAELARRNEDLTAMKAQLSLLANTDGLTRLANRRHFDTVLDRELRRLQRHGGCLSVVMLDVDCFKAYNDLRGHVAGDRCLQAIAQLLMASARRPTDTAARYGGEEFALVLPDTPAAGARQMAQQVLDDLDLLAMPHPASSAGPHVTMSAGVVTVSGDQRLKPAEVVTRADAALYRAKDAGRHCVVVASKFTEDCRAGSAGAVR
jgi:diguanylate cyclase (GGDEF)-like protein